MRNKRVLFCCLIASFSFGQDSTRSENPAIVKSVIDRMNQITGPDASGNQSDLDQLRAEMERLLALNKMLSDSLENAKKGLSDAKNDVYQANKKGFIDKYATNPSSVQYGKEQYAEFKANAFLQSLFTDENTVNVFYGMNKSETHYDLYTELQALKEKCNAAKSYSIQISSFADASGRASHNLKLVKWRSESLKKYLVSTLGLNSDAITVVENDSKDRVAQKELDFLNRRSDVVYILK